MAGKIQRNRVLSESATDSEKTDIDYAGSNRFVGTLCFAGVMASLLGVVMVVNAAVGANQWYAAIAGVLWLTCGVLALRLGFRLVKSGDKVHAGVRLKWILIGSSLFLLGAVVMVAGKSFAGH